MCQLSNVIPVVDLSNGLVVHAKEGDRNKYKPIFSPLINSSCPIIVSNALLKKTQSRILYIADLDAIKGGLLQKKILYKIVNYFPNTEIWLDGGFRSAVDFEKLQFRYASQAKNNINPVFSSESLSSIDEAKRALELFPESILSLDKKNRTLLGESKILIYPELWPKKVILMNLDRVGSSKGPDLNWIKKIKSTNPLVKIFGAGGVRNRGDVVKALKLGASGWLCSTAIHLNLISYD